MRNIESLTLYKGVYTNSKSIDPIPQLTCENLDRLCVYAPDVVQCKNIGFSGTGIYWKCEARLPQGIEFGKIHISCEGYDHPGDDNVVVGSCGLYYTLVSSIPAINYFDVIVLVVILFLVLFLLSYSPRYIRISTHIPRPFPYSPWPWRPYRQYRPYVYMPNRSFRHTPSSHISTGFGTSSSR